MPVRLGIELSPTACRIVELDSNPQTDPGAAATRIRSYARLPRGGVETRSRLSSLRHLPAAAVVWGLQADHRQVVVERHSFGRMRREAVAAMRNGGVETRGRVADIFAQPRMKGVAARSVVVALASTPGIVTAMRWLAGEGVRVQSIVTPALALMSLARLRRALTAPDRIEAYVVVEELTSALALVRNGVLLAASELAWGYQDEDGFMCQRDEMAGRLAEEIERFLAAQGARLGSLAQVCLCGGFPDLRSMAMSLMQVLDVEVETLDSLFGIDAARMPASARDFHDQAADFRLAWAVAADWPAPINLLRERNRRQIKTVLTRAAVAAGVVTGVAVAWQVQRSAWWQSTTPRQRPAPTQAASPVRRPVRPPAAAPVQRPPAVPAVAQPPVARVSVPAPSTVAAVRMPTPAPVAPPPASSPPAATSSPPAAARVYLPAPAPAPRAAVTVPVKPPPVEIARAQPPAVPPAPRLPTPLPSRLPASQAPAQPRVAPPPAQARVAPPPAQARLPLPPTAEIALPFDAVLGTILYAPERKLAIVDGRIVQAGDDVNGARVVDITPTAVMLRDAQGRLRRLGLGASTR